MAYPRHWLLTFGGSLPGDEIWQCGIRGGPQPTSDWDQREETLDNIKTPLRNWYGDVDSNMAEAAVLEWVKLNEIGPDGKYVGEALTADLTPQPGNVVSQVPDILSVCFSWTTGAKRGLAHTGRIYPPVALTARPSMIVTTNEREMFADAGKALLNAVAVGDGDYTGFGPAVVSQQGVQRNITGVRVGSVIDVQRRRKNRIVEEYSSVAWP